MPIRLTEKRRKILKKVNVSYFDLENKNSPKRFKNRRQKPAEFKPKFTKLDMPDKT